MAGIKFRPSLTIDDIQFIYDTLHTLPSSPQQQSILASLHKMILKAKHGITQPSHLATGKPTLESQLEFSDQDHTIDTLLDAWNSNPSILSHAQIERVQHHRYTHDMMSPSEEYQYEQLVENTQWQR